MKRNNLCGRSHNENNNNGTSHREIYLIWDVPRFTWVIPRLRLFGLGRPTSYVGGPMVGLFEVGHPTVVLVYVGRPTDDFGGCGTSHEGSGTTHWEIPCDA